MVQQMTDNFWQAEARSEETKKFIKDIKRLLSISEMGHFLNRTLWHDQAALTSSLRPWL